MLSSLPPHPVMERGRDIRQANLLWLAIARRTRTASRRLQEQAKQLLVDSQTLMLQQQKLVQSACMTRLDDPTPIVA
jgi:hypothetical protein